MKNLYMKKVFLLGGYDLEMLTIKKILEETGQDYVTIVPVFKTGA